MVVDLVNKLFECNQGYQMAISEGIGRTYRFYDFLLVVENPLEDIKIGIKFETGAGKFKIIKN